MIGKYKSYEQYERAIKRRLYSLIDIYNRIEAGTDRLPHRYLFLGFPKLIVHHKKEVLLRIMELCDMLHLKYPPMVVEYKEEKE